MAKFSDRLMAAYNAFSGKVPSSGKAVQEPYFYSYTVGGAGTKMPAKNTKINSNQLRNFSETVVVRRAIDWIRNNVTRLDWELEARPGVKLTAQDRKKMETAKNVLLNPNPDDSWSSWIGAILEDMLVIGEGATEVKAFSGHPERPYLFYTVDSASIHHYMDWDGSQSMPRYAQVDMHQQRIDFKSSELFLFKHNPRSNTPFGLSPTAVAIQQINYWLEAQAYAGKTASNAYPKKMLYMGSDISESQLRSFRQYMHDEIEGRSHLPVTGGHDKPDSIDLGHIGDEALFLQWQNVLVTHVANAFNLDAMKFNVHLGTTRSNGDTLDDASDEGALRPMAHQLEHYLNQYVLSLFGLAEKVQFKFRFTTSFADRKSLAVVHQIMLQDDTLLINEARREAGLPDLPVDPITGISKGEYTLSEYRAIYGGTVTLQDAVGIDNDTGTKNPIREEMENKTKQNGDGNSNGGNNGVHGAPAPKEKDVHQKNDKSLDTSL